MSVLIEAHDLFYEYKPSTQGVHDVTFHADEGDVIALVGRNGSGKTTLLNMLSGMCGPAGGELRCSPELDYHDFGVCTQKQSIDWYLNVFDNVMLGALLAGMQGAEARLATEHALRLLELDSLSKSSPEALSGGQQQRLQVARALVHEPRVLILDEPTSGLDYGYVKDLFEHLRHREAAPRSAVLVSSHDLDVLEDYCDKIIFLEEGHMRYFGRMDAFLASHQVSTETCVGYAGILGPDARSRLESLGARITDETIVFEGSRKDAVGAALTHLLGEVEITSVSSERIRLKDILIKESSIS